MYLRGWWRWRCVAAAAARDDREQAAAVNHPPQPAALPRSSKRCFYSRHAAPPLPPLFRGGAAGGPTASSFQSNAWPWLRKRMILKTNGACLVTFLVLLKRVRAHDHPALIGAMEIQRKIHFYAAQ
jgi:hypothetical protein